MSRTIDEIKQDLEDHPEHIMFLYRWLGEIKYKWEEREDLCKYLLTNIDNLSENIQTVAYAGEDDGPKGWKYLDYRKDDRNGSTSDESSNNIKENGEYLRGEDHLAMDFFRMGRKDDDNTPEYINGLGYVLDYQMPIGGTPKLLLVKNESVYDKKSNDYIYGIFDTDKESKPDLKDRLFNPGKCDLVAYDNGCLVLYELKKENNEESMLRAVMEAYTYLKMLDRERAANCLRDHYKDLIPEGNVPWEARVLLYKGKAQYKEYMKNDDSNLRKLMSELKVTPVWYTAGFSFG